MPVTIRKKNGKIKSAPSNENDIKNSARDYEEYIEPRE